MTAPRRDNQHLSGFAEYVRQESRLDSRAGGIANMDIDFIWHQYKEPSDNVGRHRRVNHVMFIEEKSRGADLAFAQRDTMYLIHQALSKLRAASYRNARGQTVKLKFWGYHKLRYSDSRPDTSEWIEWDKRRITLDQLVLILRFDIRPDTLRPMDSRLCHHTHRQSFLFNN